MIYSNERIYETVIDFCKKVEDLNALAVILGIIAIAEIIAIILIGKETEKLAKRIEQLENKKSLDKQD